jgi:hypothetical protein
MTVFAIINISDPVKLDAAVATHFPGNLLKISLSEWLVAGNGITAKDVSDKLGITDGTTGSAIVFTTAGYYGRASQNIWEWLSAKLQQP